MQLSSAEAAVEKRRQLREAKTIANTGPERADCGQRNGQQRAGRRNPRSHGKARRATAKGRRGRDGRQEGKTRRRPAKRSKPSTRSSPATSSGWKRNSSNTKPDSRRLRGHYSRAVRIKGVGLGPGVRRVLRRLQPAGPGEHGQPPDARPPVLCKACGRLLYMPESTE